MTREQKIEWLKNADADKLLKQFERCSVNVSDPFETVNRNSQYTLDGIFEDYELVKAELLSRLSK